MAFVAVSPSRSFPSSFGGARLIVAALGAFLAIGHAGLSFAQAKGEAPAINVRIGHASTGSLSLAVGMLMQARPELLRKHGLTAEWTDFSASPNNCVTTVIGGQTDACSTGMANMLSAIGQGAKLRAVATYSRPQMSLVLSKKVADQRKVTPDSPLSERLAALKGVSFARPPKGTTGYATLALLLEPSGMKIDDFGTAHEMFDPAAMAAGIRNGKWDAASWSSGPIEQAVIDGSAYSWVTLPKDALASANFPSHGMLISSAFADKNPDVARRLHAAIKEATDLLRERNPGAIEDVRKTFFPKMAPELFGISLQQAINALTESPDISPEALDKIIQFTKVSAPKGNYDKITYADVVDQAARTRK